MGSCCATDSLTYTVESEINTLAQQNLAFLKAISLYYLQAGHPGMAIKVMNIRSITKRYYQEVGKERSFVIGHKESLSEEDSEEMDKTLEREKQQLDAANRILKKTFNLYSRSWFRFKVCPFRFIQDFKKDPSMTEYYQELAFEVKRSILNGRGINAVYQIARQGKVLTTEMKNILYAVSRFTSHVATNPQKKISYVPKDNIIYRRHQNLTPVGNPKGIRDIVEEFPTLSHSIGLP